MNQLIIASHTKPSCPDALRKQADQLLAKHRDELPQEIITLLNSPFGRIVKQGIDAIKPWLASHVSQLKAQAYVDHPDYNEVRDLLARGNFVLTGNHGAAVKEQLSRWMKEVLAMDVAEVFMNNQPKHLRRAVEIAEDIERKLSKPKATKGSKGSKRSTSDETTLIPLTLAGEKRERKPKATKSAPKGLPPVQTGEVDWSQGEAQPGELKAPNPMGIGVQSRGRAVPNAGKTQQELAAKRGGKR